MALLVCSSFGAVQNMLPTEFIKKAAEGNPGGAPLTEKDIARPVNERIEKRVNKKVLKRASLHDNCKPRVATDVESHFLVDSGHL